MKARKSILEAAGALFRGWRPRAYHGKGAIYHSAGDQTSLHHCGLTGRVGHCVPVEAQTLNSGPVVSVGAAAAAALPTVETAIASATAQKEDIFILHPWEKNVPGSAHPGGTKKQAAHFRRPAGAYCSNYCGYPVDIARRGRESTRAPGVDSACRILASVVSLSG